MLLCFAGDICIPLNAAILLILTQGFGNFLKVLVHDPRAPVYHDLEQTPLVKVIEHISKNLFLLQYICHARSYLADDTSLKIGKQILREIYSEV